MGQVQSGHAPRNLTTEQLSHELALRFAKRCFTSLELYSFQDVFKTLADHQGNMAYLTEDTVTRFLYIPDVLGVSPVLFQIVSYLGAFPFGQDAPAVLGFEQMIMVVVIMTQRYTRVLKKGGSDRAKLLFRSMAVFDRQQDRPESSKREVAGHAVEHTKHSPVTGFAVDSAVEYDENEDDDDDDGLALAALEALDAIDVFKHGDAPIAQSSIPVDNLRKIIMLLLLCAPLGPQEQLSSNTDRLDGDNLDGLRKTADNVLAAFVDVEHSTGIGIHTFSTVIPVSLPFLFDGFNSLFEHFLFSRNLEFTGHADKSTAKPLPVPVPQSLPQVDIPLLPPGGNILDINILCQLSLFIPSDTLFRRLRLLYSGEDAGFSMGSFETHVFNWRAPTLLLVTGSRVSSTPTTGSEKAYAETLPPKRFKDSSQSSRLTFGVYLAKPWQQTYKECIGDSATKLFQLEPTHEVFHASSINTEYVSFHKPPTSHAGIGVGCPVSKNKPTAGLATTAPLGAVSLRLDSSFEFGVFTHNFTSGGGAFHNSDRRRVDWQDRFEIESLEVWGCGGDEEAEAQRKRWEWEEKEAEARRRVNIGKGDVEADRALLEMAGIIGQNRSGGSMR